MSVGDFRKYMKVESPIIPTFLLRKSLHFPTFFCEKSLLLSLLFMPPFKEEGYIVLNVGRSVCLSVGRSVDQMVSADYLKYHSSQNLHISHVG